MVWDRLARFRVERIKEVHHANENTFVIAAGPVGKSAIWLHALDAGIEIPKKLASGRLERKDLLGRANPIQNPPDYKRTGLHSTLLTCVVAPGKP